MGVLDVPASTRRRLPKRFARHRSPEERPRGASPTG